jgi:hypothetical protein
MEVKELKGGQVELKTVPDVRVKMVESGKLCVLELTPEEVIFIYGAVGKTTKDEVINAARGIDLDGYVDAITMFCRTGRDVHLYQSLREVAKDVCTESEEFDVSTLLDYYMAKTYPAEFKSDDVRRRVISSACAGSLFGASEGCTGRPCEECWNRAINAEHIKVYERGH